LLEYYTICPTLVLTCSQACPGLLPDLSRFSLEKAGKTGRSVGEILDQSATRSGAGWERQRFGTVTGLRLNKLVKMQTS